MSVLRNYGRFINAISAARQPSILREMTKAMATADKDMIPLSTGLPHPEAFPFTEAKFRTADGAVIDLSGQALKRGLQYQSSGGVEDLVANLGKIQQRFHSPPNRDITDIVVTSGSQDGLCKAFEMIMNPGDKVIVETFTYPGTLAILTPYKPDYVVIESDEQGMRSDSLSEKLSKWKPGDPDVPKVLYINPTGCNPTGTIVGEQRKREIYDLCCRYDLLLLEDDPYYFLQFQQSGSPPSFLSMDVEGRVIRFDSFSKVLSSGLRVGFATGPKPLMERLVLHMQVSLLHASSLSQILVNELLLKWGDEGFDKHIDFVRDFYRKRRDAINEAAVKHLTGLCEWNVPQSGMFLWLKVNRVRDTWDMIMNKAFAKNVMLVPGRGFTPDPRTPCSHMRAAFSIVPEKDMDEAMRRLAELIREEQK